MEKTSTLEKESFSYESEGFAVETIAMFITLIVGIIVITLVMMFGGVLSGQVYTKAAADIAAISNTTVKNHVLQSIESGFESYQTAGGYTPTVVLAIVIFLVLGLILSLGFTFGFSGSSRAGVSGGVL